MLEETPQAFAQALLISLNAKPPIDVEAVAHALQLDIRHVNSRAYDGAMFPFQHRAGGIVTVNGNTRERGRQRFTLAHEIGHYVLQSKASAAACSLTVLDAESNKKPRVERDADIFAVELLLPSDEVRSLVSEQGLRIATIKQVQKVFDVSLLAAAYRAVEFVEDQSAVVVTISGIVSHYYPSRKWRHRIRTNQQPGEHTAARYLFEGKWSRELCDSIYLSEWAEPADPEQKVWEEAIHQTSYSTIVSLLCVTENK